MPFTSQASPTPYIRYFILAHCFYVEKIPLLIIPVNPLIDALKNIELIKIIN